jgi:hypothetical protein
MTDESDAIKPEDDAPVTVERRIRLGSDAPKLITAAAIGAAVGAAVTHIMESSDLFQDIFLGRSGDEAPIRIKGGSITFEALSSTAEWIQVGGRNHWKLSKGERTRDEYLVVLVIQDGTGKLESRTFCGKTTIEIDYHDPHDTTGKPKRGVVELKSNGRHTHLKSTDDADRDTADPPVLTYERYIDGVKINGKPFDIPSGGKLESMLLLDC